MKKMRVFLAVFMVLFLGCKEKPEKNVVEVKEKKTTSFKVSSTFEDINGNAVELEDFKGKKVLLNFWATWCRPCIEEMPALLRAQEKLAAENYVFLLASDQSMEKIKAFKEKKKFDFRFLKFNGSLAEMKVNALPATFIYNESGTISDRIDGATEWDSPEVLNHLKAIK